jgi:alpha/beta hydrolase fold
MSQINFVTNETSAPKQLTSKSREVDGLNIAYREAGDPANPKLVLLHGFPASSHQYRDLIRVLADRFHVIAPDYPGFGNSDRPDPAKFSYTFDKISEVVESLLKLTSFDHYGLFVQDYGGPVGFRIFGRHPEALEWLIIQNTNAYEVGFTAAWDGLRGALWKNRTPETEKPLIRFFGHGAIKGIYLHGAKDPELISPDNWESDFDCTQCGKHFSASGSPKPSSSGDRMISSSPQREEKHTSRIFPKRKCTGLMRGTSRSRTIWITSPATSIASMKSKWPTAR